MQGPADPWSQATPELLDVALAGLSPAVLAEGFTEEARHIAIGLAVEAGCRSDAHFRVFWPRAVPLARRLARLDALRCRASACAEAKTEFYPPDLADPGIAAATAREVAIVWAGFHGPSAAREALEMIRQTSRFERRLNAIEDALCRPCASLEEKISAALPLVPERARLLAAIRLSYDADDKVKAALAAAAGEAVAAYGDGLARDLAEAAQLDAADSQLAILGSELSEISGQLKQLGPQAEGLLARRLREQEADLLARAARRREEVATAALASATKLIGAATAGDDAAIEKLAAAAGRLGDAAGDLVKRLALAPGEACQAVASALLACLDS